MIGDQIEISILKIERGQIQLGITAPKDIVILREEIYREIVESNVKSSLVDQSNLNKLFNLLSQE